MAMFSELELKVAKALLSGPKTLEEIEKEIGENPGEALKRMVKLGVVEIEDGKYKLLDIVKKRVEEKESAEERFLIRLIIEGMSKDYGALEKQMDVLSKKLLAEPYKIRAFDKGEPIDAGGHFSSYIEAEIGVPRFRDIVKLVVSYGPSSIELLKPDKVELSLEEAQNALNDVADAVHYYTSLIYNLKLKELEMQKQVNMLMAALAGKKGKKEGK